MSKDSKSGNSREDRIRRWLVSIPREGLDFVRIERRAGQEFEAITWAVVADLDERAADVAEAFSTALQSAADTVGSTVVGRVAAFSASDEKPLAQIPVKAFPGEGADVLPEGTYDGTHESIVGQMQQHNQALIRLVIESQMAAVRANREAMATVVGVLERIDARHASEADLVEKLREELRDNEGGDWAQSAAVFVQGVLGHPTVRGAMQLAIARTQKQPVSPQPAVEGEVEE